MTTDLTYLRSDIQLICACDQHIIDEVLAKFNAVKAYQYLDGSGRLLVFALTSVAKESDIMEPSNQKYYFVCNDGTYHELKEQTKVFPNAQRFTAIF